MFPNRRGVGSVVENRCENVWRKWNFIDLSCWLLMIKHFLFLRQTGFNLTDFTQSTTCLKVPVCPSVFMSLFVKTKDKHVYCLLHMDLLSNYRTIGNNDVEPEKVCQLNTSVHMQVPTRLLCSANWTAASRDDRCWSCDLAGQMTSERAVSSLQQQSLKSESNVGGNERLVQPAGQIDHAEVRGHRVGQFPLD